jgi:hypothetical protein
VVVAVAVAVVVVVTVVVTVVVAVLMTMPARIGPGFRLEGGVFLGHDQVHAFQHLPQHVVGLDLEVVGLQLDLHMPVAQVVGRARQVEG